MDTPPTGVPSRDDSPAVPSVPGFEVLGLIGSGGFSSVWSANETMFGRRVALKVIEAMGDQRRRLEREAVALGRLAGLPNIIQPYSVTTSDDGRLAMVLPLLATSLAQRLDTEGPLRGTDIVEWAEPLAVALDEAHSRGVSHRDIKPENVLFDSGGAAYLADFGIATVTGMSVATVTAMSLSPVHAPPERFGPSESDVRVGDRWSLASTIFTAMTGQPPFGLPSQGGLVGLINRICHDDFHPPQWWPEAVVSVFERGMAKEPSARYPSALDFVTSLRAALSSNSAQRPVDDTSSTVQRAGTVPLSGDTIIRPTVEADGRYRAGVLDLEYDCSVWNETRIQHLREAVRRLAILHEWSGAVLSVSPDDEKLVDRLIADLLAVDAGHFEPERPPPLGTTGRYLELSYDCSDWTERSCDLLEDAVDRLAIPHEWNGRAMSVSLDDEDLVDQLISLILAGEEPAAVAEESGVLRHEPRQQLQPFPDRGLLAVLLELTDEFASSRFEAESILEFVAFCSEFEDLIAREETSAVEYPAARALMNRICRSFESEPASDAADALVAATAVQLHDELLRLRSS